jgi:hypothetical protein
LYAIPSLIIYRLVGVISSTPTGETILDETLKMMKGVEEGGTAYPFMVI